MLYSIGEVAAGASGRGRGASGKGKGWVLKWAVRAAVLRLGGETVQK